MLKFPLICALIFCSFRDVSGTPFDDVEAYVDKFEKGIEELLTLSPQYAPQAVLADRAQYNLTESTGETEEYDFIIIGAGAAGAVVANRLSEIPEWKILLLEAGGYEDEITRIPYYALDLLGTKYNWGYKTIPQKKWCLGQTDKRCVIEMGKAIGGSTVINGLLYTRGNSRDYDKWADLGNKGWCFNDVFPYFKKVEDAHLNNFDRKYHRYGGKIHVENSQDRSILTEGVLRAAYELHIPFVDYNGKEQLGIGFSQGTTKNGKRWSSAKGYLEETKNRPNLVVKPFSLVTKILINPQTKEAYGVKFINKEKLHVAKATKEVIVSAGALNTPQLLQLSGIGPKEQLKKLKIDPLSDLMVGTPLRTHLGFPGLKFIFNNTKAVRRNDREDLINYLKNGKGPLAAIFTDLVAYLKTDVSKDKGNYPDVEVLFVPYVEEFQNQDERSDKEVIGVHAISITIVLMRPKSYGSIQLADGNIMTPPLIDLNHLADKEDFDIETLLSGVRQVQKFVKTPSFKKLGAYIEPSIVQDCRGFDYDSDSYWKCAIRHQSYSLRHPTGTAKMGPPQDKEAVVNNQLQVYGINNLRVVDNSVVPVSITGHMMAPAYMIGEKASDMIKEYWSWRV
ncbi:glucose dehydrogenase [FAD, quinone]-like isoform X1 [Harmonia axyridis]|uniref:glucose dehydrogenase [FAD, quinone]-like isoform X1 n=1 Tax=Harmonia axyridis TaxID=115357 RepID=UPI001E278110|nr:glucose dehydrogenase [FAD, quinone]-like isoform X1 [Harmonia axyridis]